MIFVHEEGVLDLGIIRLGSHKMFLIKRMYAGIELHAESCDKLETEWNGNMYAELCQLAVCGIHQPGGSLRPSRKPQRSKWSQALVSIQR